MEDGTDKVAVCTANILPRKVLKLFGDLKICEQEIRTVKYESNLALFVRKKRYCRARLID